MPEHPRPLSSGATLADVAFAVSTALLAAGEQVVLCGGSAATFYAPEAYDSRDLDFVITFGARAKTVSEALAPLGYSRRPEGLYAHPELIYTIDFLPGPVAIGEETISTFHIARRGNEELRVLTVTDVVRDRVLAYWAWADFRALDVAAAIARIRGSEFDRGAFTRWARQLADSGVYDAARFPMILSTVLGS